MKSIQRFVLAAALFGEAIVFAFSGVLLGPADSLLQTIAQVLTVPYLTCSWFFLVGSDAKPAKPNWPPAEALEAATTRWAGKRHPCPCRPALLIRRSLA